MSGRLDKAARICRREVLLPGDLLPEEHRAPGKHHGTVTKVVRVEGGGHLASVTMTDFGKLTKKLKLEVALERVLPFLLPKKERPKGLRFEAERCHEPPADARPAPAKKRRKAAGGVPQRGQELAAYMKRLEAVVSSPHPPGTRLWVRVPGSGRSPGVSWSFGLCKRKDMGQLLTSYRPGLVCVKFYGEHSLMWVREEDCELPPDDESELIRQFKAWGRQHNKMRLVELALDEVVGAHGEPEKELRRMVLLYDQYLQTRQALDNCYLCRELGARLQCGICDRLFHPLCLLEPALGEEEILEGAAGNWACPCCGEDNVLGEEREEDGENEDGAPERMGLTPDWLIEAAAFHVFELERPHARRPYIPRLLDPCTNSKLAPNIPAEVLYDKRDNGLKLSNSWAGYYIVLNPDYRAQVQWRFVNRCIDEVENDAVPAAILICRNSTDTAYFQRLRPYPRVLLRRMSARFKDYDKTPIGFGIAVFCIAKSNCRELYERFFDAFEPMGEPNVPVDKTFIQTEEYVQLLDRLRSYASQHHRDHWVQCSACEKWRIVDFKTAMQIGDDDEWTCALLRPPHTSCDTPLSKREMVGGRYAAGGADFLELTPQEKEGGEGEGEAKEEEGEGGEGEAKEEEREGAKGVAEGEEWEGGQQLGVEGHQKAAAAATTQWMEEGGVQGEARAGTGGRSGIVGAAGAEAEVLPGQGSNTCSPQTKAPAAPQLVAHTGMAVTAAAACSPMAAAPPSGPPQPPHLTLQSSFQSANSTAAVRPAVVGPLPQLPPGVLAPWLLPPVAWQNPALRPLLMAAAAAGKPLFGMPGPAGMQLLQPMPAGPAGGPAGDPQPVPPGLPGQALPQQPLPQQPLQPLIGPPGGSLPGRPPLLPPLVFNLPSRAVLPHFLPFPATPMGKPPLPTVASPTALSAVGSPLATQASEPFAAPAALATTTGLATALLGRQLPSFEKESSNDEARLAKEGEGEGCQAGRPKQETGSAAGPSAATAAAEAARQAPPLPHPLPPAEQVVCEKTLRDLISLPPRNITLDREEGDSGQVLTALELARQARIAANRAYLAGLGLGPAAMHGGHVQPLAPGDPVMLQAARELATQAAAEEAKRQLTRMQQHYEAARRRRAKLEPQLLAQLRALKEEEEAAARELAAAEVAAQEFEVAGGGDG